MYLLYPRLRLPVAEALASERASLGLVELLELSNTTHDAVQFAPTGGNRIDSRGLEDLQAHVRGCAEQHGYPGQVNDDLSRKFDIQCGIILHRNMHLHPSEASNLEMWAFLTCILLPDVVRWRFPGEITSIERFIGSDRGLRRNTFGRLWWRAYLLYQPNRDNPYELLDWLVEDDLVQITERNSIAASPPLLIAFCAAFLRAVELHSDLPRRALMREAVKRVRRLLSVISFDALDNHITQSLIDTVVADTVAVLQTNREALPAE